jgi:hypothetical protein
MNMTRYSLKPSIVSPPSAIIETYNNRRRALCQNNLFQTPARRSREKIQTAIFYGLLDSGLFNRDTITKICKLPAAKLKAKLDKRKPIYSEQISVIYFLLRDCKKHLDQVLDIIDHFPFSPQEYNLIADFLRREEIIWYRVFRHFSQERTAWRQFRRRKYAFPVEMKNRLINLHKVLAENLVMMDEFEKNGKVG